MELIYKYTAQQFTKTLQGKKGKILNSKDFDNAKDADEQLWEWIKIYGASTYFYTLEIDAKYVY